MTRRILHVLLLTMVAAVTMAARWDYTPADTLAALEDAGPRVRCAVFFEVGRGKTSWEGVFPPWDPSQLGDALERGPGQLHPQGELLRFKREGWGDEWNPYDVIPYMTHRFAEGGARAWYGPRLGLTANVFGEWVHC